MAQRQPRQSLLRSEKRNDKRPENTFTWMSPVPLDGPEYGGWGVRVFVRAVYAEDGIGIGPEVDTP